MNENCKRELGKFKMWANENKRYDLAFTLLPLLYHYCHYLSHPPFHPIRNIKWVISRVTFIFIYNQSSHSSRLYILRSIRFLQSPFSAQVTRCASSHKFWVCRNVKSPLRSVKPMEKLTSLSALGRDGGGSAFSPRLCGNRKMFIEAQIHYVDPQATEAR